MAKNRKYEEKYVAFIDILGFKSLVKESLDNIETYNNIIKSLKVFINEKITQEKYDNAKVTTFSDNIVISVDGERDDNLLFLVIFVIHMQMDLFRLGILIRGGIAKGLVRHTDEYVFGPALNRAYELESKYAIYPRIVLDINLYKDRLNKYELEEFYCTEDVNIFKSCFVEDLYNNLVFINTLNFESELDYDIDLYIDYLTLIKEKIEKGLNDNSADVRNKYVWMANYYNDTVRKKKKIYSSYIKRFNSIIIKSTKIKL